MIEIDGDQLVFRFPEVHPDAVLAIEFQRTLRIPCNDKTYPLPPGLGRFPLELVDDHADSVPDQWIARGGAMLPMHQSEAMWIRFNPKYVSNRNAAYPFAVKIYTGKVNAVTGEPFQNGLNDDPQDYVVAPGQPWLDGYCVSKGIIRQFVAMPLGKGHTVEEQLTGKAEHGGVQIVVYPMKGNIFEERFPIRRQERLKYMAKDCWGSPSGALAESCRSMGLAGGGKMKQEIYEDQFDLFDWSRKHRGRCYVHILNSLQWKGATGSKPPTKPPGTKEYNQAGLPWFDYYDDSLYALAGSKILKGIKPVKIQKPHSWDDDEDVDEDNEDEDDDCHYPRRIIKLRAGLRRGQVREGTFWEDSI